MDDDDFGHDADLVALTESAERSTGAGASRSGGASNSNPAANTNSQSNKIVQPTPRALPQRHAPSSIIVSTRQKGNPLLTHITALPWEYGDIVPDYIIGATACALFLSLKYHRLHPEYIYSRMRALGHKYNLRVLLVTVDIDNHEEPLRELAKTSLVNDYTLILTWSAREAARYLENYKILEHATPSAIRGSKPASYTEQMVEFVTTPRGVNKTDAVALLGAFGSVREACNAPVEALATLQGWGEVKVKRWHRTVREPFRTTQAKEQRAEAQVSGVVEASRVGAAERAERAERAAREAEQVRKREAETAQREAEKQDRNDDEPGDDDEEEALRQIATTTQKRTRAAEPEPELDAGIAAALAKYRKV